MNNLQSMMKWLIKIILIYLLMLWIDWKMVTVFIVRIIFKSITVLMENLNKEDKMIYELIGNNELMFVDYYKSKEEYYKLKL